MNIIDGDKIKSEETLSKELRLSRSGFSEITIENIMSLSEDLKYSAFYMR